MFISSIFPTARTYTVFLSGPHDENNSDEEATGNKFQLPLVEKKNGYMRLLYRSLGPLAGYSAYIMIIPKNHTISRPCSTA